jgi:RNA polymerase sigma-54 factor
VSLAPRLDLRQTQSLVMTPQLQQAIRLLALSNLEIEGFLGEAVESNPLLELGEPAPPAGDDAPLEERRTRLESSPVDQLIEEGRAGDDRPLDIDPAAADDAVVGVPGGSADYVADWGGAAGTSPSDDWTPLEDRDPGPTSLSDHLHGQIGLVAHDPSTAAIARHLVGLLDDTGYLTGNLEEVAAALGVDIAQVEQALALVQSLDPAGVGARSLAECITLQAREADRYDPAMACLIGQLDLVARGEFAKLRRMCAVDEEDFAEMLAELRGYDPKPGLRYGGEAGAPVVPDILIAPGREGGWDISLNQATLPRLVVNRSYYLELRHACADRAARGWLSEKLSDANWLIKALDQRQKTILKVAAEIVRRQDGFFRHGVAHLRPLTLRAVAEAIGMHESTVSRVTSNKYLSCGRGTFELKYFFTSGVARVGASGGATDGEGTVSAVAVKAAIRQLIDAERPDAVLSDDTLVDLLRARGFDLARRTVAKYREAIGLGSSVQRRRQKALAGIGS